jgi:hypothetical protein
MDWELSSELVTGDVEGNGFHMDRLCGAHISSASNVELMLTKQITSQRRKKEMKTALRIMLGVAIVLLIGVLGTSFDSHMKAQSNYDLPGPDPSPRIQMLGWEIIDKAPGGYDGIPTRASVLVDRATHKEIMCLGINRNDAGVSCFLTGRLR